MKKPVVDYRQFRPGKLNDPQFSHLKLLGGWILYFILYFLTENLIPPEKCTSIHIWLDDVIPFCEWFLIPYVLWYGLIVFSLGYFALYNIDSFKSSPSISSSPSWWLWPSIFSSPAARICGRRCSPGRISSPGA